MTPEQIVQAMLTAYADNDRESIEPLLADDFTFTSPLDDGIDRATYFDRCWPNKVIAGFDLLTTATAGDAVFVLYEGEKTDGSRFRNVELHRVRNERVVAVEVYFGWSIPRS